MWGEAPHKESLFKKEYIFYGVGGAICFDTIVALTLIELKKKYNHIKIILVLPCINQDKYWNEEDKKIYEYIKVKSDKCVYISKEYTKECMLKRNRHLVDYSSICIAYVNKNTGGSAYTISYAKKKGVKVINIFHDII